MKIHTGSRLDPSIRCDHCTQKYLLSRDKQDQEYKASLLRENGWVIEENRTVCRECAERYELKEQFTWKEERFEKPELIMEVEDGVIWMSIKMVPYVAYTIYLPGGSRQHLDLRSDWITGI